MLKIEQCNQQIFHELLIVRDRSRDMSSKTLTSRFRAAGERIRDGASDNTQSTLGGLRIAAEQDGAPRRRTEYLKFEFSN